MKWLIHKLPRFCMYMCDNHSKKWLRVSLETSTESANQRATFDHLTSATLTCYGDYI